MDYGVAGKLIEGMTENFNRLGTNTISAAERIQKSTDRLEITLQASSKELAKTLDQLNANIVDFTTSGDSQARAMKWLTAALVLVGVLQIIFH